MFSSEPRKSEQIVDQLGHTAGFSAHYGEAALCVIIKMRAVIFLEHACIPADRAQRRAQIMRHRIAETLEFLVSRFELLGAYRDAVFQRTLASAAQLALSSTP